MPGVFARQPHQRQRGMLGLGRARRVRQPGVAQPVVAVKIGGVDVRFDHRPITPRKIRDVDAQHVQHRADVDVHLVQRHVAGHRRQREQVEIGGTSGREGHGDADRIVHAGIGIDDPVHGVVIVGARQAHGRRTGTSARPTKQRIP